ncbi:lysozyme inhibitor LprI family protein [Stenotrophomonas rhizophila]|uniref:lysozyme inhibitor LprI family protein n=1 Tax=Stenotrophomonas rhizophila TaxID=216778 RepID=UPI001E3B7C45|nr:lysozyme inhibitor LprI family protein [Stenotrophomonas rhizophila]MCC7633072.1 DUF1311 domain-containing protein [Stenotrophomonas rhizophila]MCC7661965.1 DUF1311 domain-containing protein [Stenotrophomonas rhizophila]
MQASNGPSAFHRTLAGPGRGWAVLALSLALALAACQAPEAAPAPHAGTTASATPAATAAPAAAPAPAATTSADADAATADDDLPAPLPDDSYRNATLRPEYSACVGASGGVTPALQACGDEEFAYQQGRLRAAFATIVAGPDGKAKDALMDEQAAYMDDTDRYCSWNPEEDGQGQMLDAQSCRINRTANRADQLQALTSK